MSPYWFQALTETDKGVADALAPCLSVSPAMPAARPDEAAACVQAWLANQYPCPNMAIVAGASQVDLMEPLLDRIASIRVLLLDRNPERLAGALNGVDSLGLAQAVRDGRLVIDIGETEDAGTERFLRAADYSRVPVIRLLDARPLSEEENQLADEMTRPARDLLRVQACDMSTRKRFGKEWQNQTLRNIPQMIRHAGIQSLFGQFAGHPALVIAAGPSLDAALPYIRKLRERFVIISIARPVGRLTKFGKITPDLVVTGDGQSLVAKHFTRVPAGLPVVASCFTHPGVIRDLDRIFFMEMESMGLPEWLRSKLGELGEIHAGGNVATAAMSVAVALGCNPVLTVGMDLSYSDSGKTHATGKLGEMAGPGLKPKEIYYDVQGNYQPLVKTNRQMMHYVDFTNELIAYYSGTTFVNVNTAGARLTGAQLIRPEELEQFAGPPVAAAPAISRIYEGQIRRRDVGSFCAALRDDLPQLESLRTQCLNAAMICNQMIMLMRRPASVPNAVETVRSCLEQLGPLDERLKNDPVMNLLESRLESAARLLAEKMMSPEEHALSPAVRSFWRWREYYKSVADACRWSANLLTGVIQEIEAGEALPETQVDFEINPQPVETYA